MRFGIIGKNVTRRKDYLHELRKRTNEIGFKAVRFSAVRTICNSAKKFLNTN